MLGLGGGGGGGLHSKEHYKGEIDGEWSWDQQWGEGGQHHPTSSQDCVTLMKAAATAKSSASAVKLYPEEYSCNM